MKNQLMVKVLKAFNHCLNLRAIRLTYIHDWLIKNLSNFTYKVNLFDFIFLNIL